MSGGCLVHGGAKKRFVQYRLRCTVFLRRAFSLFLTRLYNQERVPPRIGGNGYINGTQGKDKEAPPGGGHARICDRCLRRLRPLRLHRGACDAHAR